VIPNEYRELIIKLEERSRNNEINWQTTSQDDRFIVIFKKGFSLTIYFYRTPKTNEEFIKVGVHNETGVLIDEFTVEKSSEDGQIMYRLYQSARRKAHRIDLAIKSMLEEIKGDEKVGDSTMRPAVE
jgi:hypothetical protein